MMKTTTIAKLNQISKSISFALLEAKRLEILRKSPENDKQAKFLQIKKTITVLKDTWWNMGIASIKDIYNICKTSHHLNYLTTEVLHTLQTRKFFEGEVPTQKFTQMKFDI